MSQRFLSPAAGLGSSVIDRGKRLNFKLNGHEIAAFEGDTVLSAALGAGIAGAGRLRGSPLSLRPGLSPNVRTLDDKSGGVPMALCLVRDGLDVFTVGGGARGVRQMAAQFGNPRLRAFGLDLATTPLADPVGAAKITELKTDLLVVGGGLAGMSAALAAAQRGERVMLIEERARLGGDAALFGNREGEEPVLEQIADLEKEIADTAGITVRVLCRAVDAGPNGVTTLRAGGGRLAPEPLVERISAIHVVLATGCADRLPIYPGNRLPGVSGLADAFHLAGAYGIWPENPTFLAGGTNALYHLAVLAKDSGADLVRLIDHRAAPRSRFVDFAKASGVHQQFGTRISGAKLRRGGLAVETMLSLSEKTGDGRAMHTAGSVIHSDGWRPRLTLWARFGGKIGWDGNKGIATGDLAPAGVALAGSVTGLLTNDGCRRSGTAAVAHLFGDPPVEIGENTLADYIESPDAEPLSALPSTGEPAFLASGRILSAMPKPAAARKEGGVDALAPDVAGELDFETLSSLTYAGLTPTDRYAVLCAEKLVSPETVVAADTPSDGTPDDTEAVPDYLRGRFTEPLEQITLNAEDGRRFTPGLLVFADSSAAPPEAAIGVIVSGSDGGGVAALSAEKAAPLVQVSVRDGVRPIGARIVRQKT